MLTKVRCLIYGKLNQYHFWYRLKNWIGYPDPISLLRSMYKLIVAQVPWFPLFIIINCGCVNAVILCLWLGHQKDQATF